jgi:S1-C subfamily serine protease
LKVQVLELQVRPEAIMPFAYWRRCCIGIWLPAVLLAALLSAAPSSAQGLSVDDLLSGVVRIKTFINPEGRTNQTLGREREGSGVLIGSDGLVLTIGYLMVEAQSAEVTDNDGRRMSADIVGYDHETGFGLLRAPALKARPIPIGKSAELVLDDKVLVAGGGGAAFVGPVKVVSKRRFAGSWEYLLDEALFTAPAVPWWSGAALITRDGRLAGIGSLAVADAAGRGKAEPGNMFVPIDRLLPILADLIADGRVSTPAKPWLGISTEEQNGRLVVQRVTTGGPAERAGIKSGDTITAVGSRRPNTLIDLYQAIWGHGPAGVTVTLNLLRNGSQVTANVTSMNRLDHLKLGSSF